MTRKKVLSVNYCPSVKRVGETKTYITSASSTNSCAFVNEDEILNPDTFRQTCSEKCGQCCQNGYCGPWLPCEFIDFQSHRVELTSKNTTVQIKNEKLVHNVDWQKVLNYIAAGYAIVRYTHYRGKDYYFLDVPCIEVDGYKQCGLLSETGCALDFNHRPIRGASIGPATNCASLQGMGDYQCWSNDPYLFEVLHLIYITQKSGEIAKIHLTQEEPLALIKQIPTNEIIPGIKGLRF